MKEDQRIAAAELQRQKRKEVWAKEQATKEQEFHQTIADSYKELEGKINRINFSFNEELGKLEMERQNQVIVSQNENKAFWTEVNNIKTDFTGKFNTLFFP